MIINRLCSKSVFSLMVHVFNGFVLGFYKLTHVRLFVRLSSVTSFSRDSLISFFLIFGTMMQNSNPQNVKENFWPKIQEICRKNRFFGIFSRFYFSAFLIFCTKMRISNSQKWLSPIFEKHFFPAENTGNIPELAIFADFHWTFSLNFVVFHTKTLLITMPTIKHGSIVIKLIFVAGTL